MTDPSIPDELVARISAAVAQRALELTTACLTDVRDHGGSIDDVIAALPFAFLEFGFQSGEVA